MGKNFSPYRAALVHTSMLRNVKKKGLEKHTSGSKIVFAAFSKSTMY